MMRVVSQRCKAHGAGMTKGDDSLHVVLGAGQVGARVADLLLDGGARVRQVRRGAPGPARPGLEWVQGDITDPAVAAAAGRGAAVVYDCMNPAYHQWADHLLPLGRAAVRTAASSGARLVALDCLYMYGLPAGPIAETSPLAPCSRKGALRVELGAMRMDAHARGDVQVAIGRASDFFGADLPYSLFSDRFYRRILAGKAAEVMGDPDMPHSYTYVDDIARALITLGEDERALGHVWHLPTAPAETTRALMQRMARALDVRIDVTGVPRLLVRALGLVSPFMREVAEMMYQWQAPFVIDDSRFRATFGYGATPVDDQVRRTAAWAAEHYGVALSAVTSSRPA
jgi:nucleoside-diphosphate-sugar epimerase